MSKREVAISEVIEKKYHPPVKSFNVVVEGNTDEIFYKKIFNKGVCKIIPMYGVDNVKYIFGKNDSIDNEFIQEIQKKQVIGLIDRDFQDTPNMSNIYKSEKYQNLFVTETNDLETLVLKNGGIQLFCSKLCNKKTQDHFKKKHNIQDLESFIISLSNLIGVPRCINSKENWGISFKILNITEIFCKDGLSFKSISLKNIIDMIFANQKNNPNKDDFERKCNKKLEEIDNLTSMRWDLCQGHDTINILLCIQFKIGKELELKTEDDLFQRISNLFLDSDGKFFTKTSLCQTLIDWESKHFPFKDKKMLKSKFY